MGTGRLLGRELDSHVQGLWNRKIQEWTSDGEAAQVLLTNSRTRGLLRLRPRGYWAKSAWMSAGNRQKGGGDLPKGRTNLKEKSGGFLRAWSCAWPTRIMYEKKNEQMNEFKEERREKENKRHYQTNKINESRTRFGFRWPGTFLPCLPPSFPHFSLSLSFFFPLLKWCWLLSVQGWQFGWARHRVQKENQRVWSEGLCEACKV